MNDKVEIRVNCQKCDASILPETFETYKGICKPCYKENIRQQKTNLPTENIDEDQDWELLPENAHPTARQYLKEEFFWDIIDEAAPFGNDDGWDTLMNFRDWRLENPSGNPNAFLRIFLERWGINNNNWNLQSEEEIKCELEEDKFTLFARNNLIIALAFGQIIIDGFLDDEIRKKAIWAIQRNKSNVLLEGWRQYRGEREERLEVMEKILKDFK